jgi:hypothetical protein
MLLHFLGILLLLETRETYDIVQNCNILIFYIDRSRQYLNDGLDGHEYGQFIGGRSDKLFARIVLEGNNFQLKLLIS